MATATLTTAEADDVIGDLRIIDCDAHITEPNDLWTARAPAALRDKVPVQETHDGISAWYLNGDLWAGIGGNTIETGRRKVIGEHILQPFSRVDESAWDVKARLALMDEMGVGAQIIYPNGVGFTSHHIFAIEDEQQRATVLQIYNDFLVELQHESKERLLPQAMLPVWDIDFTLREMERMQDEGIRGFTISDKPELLGLPELNQPYFEPMWDRANATSAVMNFHIGGGGRAATKTETKELQQARLTRPAESGFSDLYWSSFGPQRRLAILATQMYMSNARIIVNLCMSDLFDRYPNLKIVSAESGIGWIPFIFEALEYQVDEMVTDPTEQALQQRRPSEYFRDHIYVTFWFERVGPSKLLDDIGVNNVLVETDVPHPTCLYPGARERFASVMAGLDPAVRRRVFQDNAAELYSIKV